jgi:hypothetical protein
VAPGEKVTAATVTAGNGVIRSHTEYKNTHKGELILLKKIETSKGKKEIHVCKDMYNKFSTRENTRKTAKFKQPNLIQLQKIKFSLSFFFTDRHDFQEF